MNLKTLQEAIAQIDYHPDKVDQYFYKLSEEVGELAKAIRKNNRMKDHNIKETIEEECYDVIYYVCCLANCYGFDLEKCAILKEERNALKYQRPSIFEKIEKLPK